MHPSFTRHKRVAGRMVANEPAWLKVLLILAASLIVAVGTSNPNHKDSTHDAMSVPPSGEESESSN